MGKKATTINEQIELLKQRGMFVTDEQKAEEILLDVGFYRLGFYAFPFERTFPNLNNRTHLYKEGTCFTDIVELYYFDYDLRNILTYYLNRIEVNLRTFITYTVSNYYKDSPTWFVDSAVMNRSYIDDFEAKVYKTIRENPVIKRHHQKYINDRFAPAWKTVEFMTLGNICSLFYNLKDENLKRQIASNYKCSLKVFSNYIETIRVIRNTCAHGACIYNISLAKGIKSTPLAPISETKRHSISGVIDVIRHMIGCISVNRLNQMNDELNSLLKNARSEKTANIIANCTGFAIK